MTKQTNSTTDQIFFAVMELILQGGIPAVTLSSVCKRAGISKGGLMYHYPTKEALVDAFISRSSDECLNEIREHVRPIVAGTGKRTKAFIDLMLKDPAMCHPESSREIAAVMIALMQGRMLSQAHDYYVQLAKELQSDGVSQSVIELVIASVDGLWLQAAVLPAERVAKSAAQVRIQLRRVIDNELEKRASKSARTSNRNSLSVGASR